MPTNNNSTNVDSQNPQPVFINPNSQNPQIIQNLQRKSKVPKPLLWFLGCLGGCFTFLLVSLIMLSVLVTIFASAFNTTITENIIQDGSEKGKIAIIPISGVIIDEQEGNSNLNLSSTAGSSKIIKLLDIALNDNDVKAVLIRENTPGGSTLAMRKICNKIKIVDNSKPVYTYIESEGASAGYYIANCTRFIVADKQAITGSIGALVEITDIQGLLDKLGIKTKVITNTQGTQKQSDIFSQNSNDEKKLKTILDQAYEDFIRQIVEGRNNTHKTNTLSEDKIRTLATGEIYSGSQAKTNGLVDDNGFIEDAIKTVISRSSLSSQLKVVEYSYNGGAFSGISSSLQNLFGVSSNIQINYSTLFAIRH